MKGNRKTVDYTELKAKGDAELKQERDEDLHSFSPTGFLDDALWHRTYWL